MHDRDGRGRVSRQQPVDGGKIIETEWWVKSSSKGDLYAKIAPAFIRATPGAVRVTYHAGSPDAEETLRKTNKSVAMAQHILSIRGFRRFQR